MPTTIPVFDLRDAVADQIAAAIGTPVEKRIVAYTKRADVRTGKWIATAAGEETIIVGRSVDESTLTIDVGYQIALPESTADYPDPMENTPWFAEQMAAVESVKLLFRGETDDHEAGALRDADFSGMSFVRLTNGPIYRPDLLIDFQIFTSVIRLEFIGEV
jgi:hypothetical protein